MIAAIVLAAGQAARFGRCKPLALLDGKPLLEHVLDTLHLSVIDDVVVVLGARAGEIRERVRFGSQRVILNPAWGDGMSSSIQAGLRALPPAANAVLIVLADQPFVRPATIDTLVETYSRTGAAIVIPMHRGARGNPVLVDRTLFAEMMELRGDIGLRALFSRHAERIVKVEAEDPGVVTDIDSQEDLDRVSSQPRTSPSDPRE